MFVIGLGNTDEKTYLFTSNSLWIRLTETHASVRPFSTHGNAFNGPINIFNKAILVNTVLASSTFPSKTYVEKVRSEIKTGVVAQKYTQSASKYFRPFKYLISFSRKPVEDKK